MRQLILWNLVISFFLIGPAEAAVFNPTTADELQSDLNTAASNNDNDIINLGAITYLTTDNTIIGGPTFNYTSTQNDDLVIVGMGADQSVLDGNNQHRVLTIDNMGTGSITLQNFTIQNGNSQGAHRAGLSLENPNGDILIENCEILNNLATQPGEQFGGGVINSTGGMVTMTNCVLRGNRADESYGGLDINSSGPLTFTDNILEDNQALNGSFGAIDLNANAPSLVARNTFINNRSGDNFGAGRINVNDTLEFSGNTFQGNSAVGSIGAATVNARGLTANANTFLDNESLGGDIGGASFSFSNSNDGTFTNNLAARNTAAGDTGGILLSGAGFTVDAVNNTFYGNSAGGNGGGVTLDPTFDTTVINFYNNISFANQAGGMAQDIFYDNATAPNATLNLFNNLFSEFCQANPAGCDSMALGPNQGSNILGQDPLLVDPTMDNFYPGPNSPALETADPNAPNFPNQDHDGNPRPTGALPDIGAFEALGMIAVDPLTHDFGQVALQNSGEVIITISNIGGIPLNVLGMNLDDNTNFQLDLSGGNNPCGTATPTIQPGESCTVAIIFNPTFEGLIAGILTIDSDDLQLPSVAVNLTGTGIGTGSGLVSGGGCQLGFGNSPAHVALPLLTLGIFLLLWRLQGRFRRDSK